MHLVALHYCRLNVRTSVARTPQSMKKGIQVLRNAAQLEDRKRVKCVRVIINTWILIVCGRKVKALFTGMFCTDKDT